MKKGKLMEKIARLLNIDVREVSLVDRPAINEPFTEVKRKDGNGNTQEEKVMDEKKIVEIIQKTLAPLADGLKAIETGLEAQSKSAEEAGKKVDGLVVESQKGTKTSEESLEAIKVQLKEIVEDTVKRFDRIEGLVTKASSQKIAGQGDGEEGEKDKAKWPSLSSVK